MIGDWDIESFLEALASKEPVPGGGGASALAGAMGCAAGAMSAALTSGKKKYADVEEDIQEAIRDLEGFRATFLRLADKDEEVFLPLSKAYGLPKETEEEKMIRDRVMENCTYDASMVPLSVMETAVAALKVLRELSGKAAKIAVSDTGVGAAFLRTALEGAALNVRINVKSMKREEVRERLTMRYEALLKEGLQAYEASMEQVKTRIG